MIGFVLLFLECFGYTVLVLFGIGCIISLAALFSFARFNREEARRQCLTYIDPVCYYAPAHDGLKTIPAQKNAAIPAPPAESYFYSQPRFDLTAFLNAYRNNSVFRARARQILLFKKDCDPEFAAELARFIRAAQTTGSNDD